MTRRIRAAGGLVAGPFVSAAVHATYVQDVAAAWPALLIAAAGCVCLGLPALALVRRRGPARLGHVVLAGVCAALVAAVVLFLYITVSHGETSPGRSFGIFSSCLPRTVPSLRWCTGPSRCAAIPVDVRSDPARRVGVRR